MFLENIIIQLEQIKTVLDGRKQDGLISLDMAEKYESLILDLQLRIAKHYDEIKKWASAHFRLY